MASDWDDFCLVFGEIARKYRTKVVKQLYRKDPRVLERERESQRRRKPWLKPEVQEAKRRRRADPEYKRRRKEESYTLLARCKRYGITVSNFWDTYNEQSGACLVCDKPFETVTDEVCPRTVNFDHDHETSKFRGLLCTGCNTTVGYIERALRMNKLDSIVKYVNYHKGSDETF